MNKENQRGKKSCLFFASDYHFEMITLPYINKKIKDDANVIVLTENNLRETIDILLSKINLNEEEKRKIEKINWEKSSEEKIKEIKDYILDREENIVLIKGNKNYINSMNNSINNIIDCNKVTIIDCYDINEIQEESKDIVKNYNSVLTTTGIRSI